MNQVSPSQSTKDIRIASCYHKHQTNLRLLRTWLMEVQTIKCESRIIKDGKGLLYACCCVNKMMYEVKGNSDGNEIG